MTNNEYILKLEEENLKLVRELNDTENNFQTVIKELNLYKKRFGNFIQYNSTVYGIPTINSQRFGVDTND